MLCKCHWIVLFTVHFTAFCLGGPFFPGHGVLCQNIKFIHSFISLKSTMTKRTAVTIEIGPTPSRIL